MVSSHACLCLPSYNLGRQRQAWLIPIEDERVGVHCAGKTVRSLENIVLYLSASEVMIYEEALYQVYVSLPYGKGGRDGVDGWEI